MLRAVVTDRLTLPSTMAVKKPTKRTKTSKPKKPVAKSRKNAARPISVGEWTTSRKGLTVEYSTDLGAAIVGKSEDVLGGRAGKALRGQVQLVFSSPPFPLNRKKKYGNKEGQAFKKWLCGYAETLTG